MTSRERVSRAVSFEGPDRIPISPMVTGQYWLSHSTQECSQLIDYLNGLPLDVRPYGGAEEIKARLQGAGKRTWKDSWGCTWEVSIPGEFGTVVEHPLADWENAETYTFPDDLPEAGPDSNQTATAFYTTVGGADRYGVLWYQMQFLRGYEGIMMDLGADHERVCWLRDRVLEKRIAYLKKVLELHPHADAVYFGDCWGQQTSLMISPVQWREIFKPAYKQLFDTCHDAGKKVFFQSDGYTINIISDLIEIGANILRVSVGMMDMSKLGDIMRGRACLAADPCRQHILPHGSPDQVREHVQAIVDAFATPAGGLIGGLSIEADYPLANIKAALDTFAECRVPVSQAVHSA